MVLYTRSDFSLDVICLSEHAVVAVEGFAVNDAVKRLCAAKGDVNRLSEV